MPKVICLFNHKGGVSKTTTVFHLGWMLAKLGKRVLIVDADPQCNLTGLTLGIEDYDSLQQFYDSRKNSNIYSSIENLFLGRTINVEPASVTSTHNPSLFILAGNIKLAEADIQIATALTSSETIPVLRNFIGSFDQLLRRTADKHNIDIVIVDMSPSVSAMNMCILMGSDYFIIPTSPDFYCYQAIDSLSTVLPEWETKFSKFRDGITLPRSTPKMMGIICQNFRVYTKKCNKNQTLESKMTRKFSEWAQKIKEITHSKLVQSFSEMNLIIPEEIFSENVTYDVPYNLANIQDFNSLLPVSQEHSKPMYEIEQEDTTWTGTVWDNEKLNIDKAEKIYTDLARAVIGIANCGSR